ncbi:hypothetical protein Tco_0790160 [Tanacetum coccineum]
MVTDPIPSSSTPSSSSPKPTLSMSQHILSLFKTKPGQFKRYKSFFDELQGRYDYLFGHLKTRFLARKKFNVLAQHLQEVMEEALPKMMQFSENPRILGQRFLRKLTMLSLTIFLLRSSAIRQRDQDDPHDDAHPEGENSVKRQKTCALGTYVFGESSSGQVNESEPGLSTSGNQEQIDDFDFWTDSYATDDDELPSEKVSQELVEEMSQTVDEAKLRKVVNEMKEILVSQFPPMPTPVVQSCQRDPKAPALSIVNQDLLYLKKGNSGPEKIVLSLHKFRAIIFLDDDIEERTSR